MSEALRMPDGDEPLTRPEAIPDATVRATPVETVVMQPDDEDEMLENTSKVEADPFEPAEDVEKLRMARKAERETTSADPVRAYLKQIGKVALLSAREEIDLSRRIEAGLYAGKLHEKLTSEPKELSPAENEFVQKQRRKAARFLKQQGLTAVEPNEQLLSELEWVAQDGERAKAHLLEANLRLVVSLAKRYTGHGMAFLDLIQEGNLGLIRAVEKFDYAKGFKFSTYATWWIRQAVSRSMADQARTIGLPVHMAEKINKMSRIEREMLQELGRDPTNAELAHELGLTEDKVQEIKDHNREPVRLDQTVGDDGNFALGDYIEDTTAVVAHDAVVFMLLRNDLEDMLKDLTEREAGVMKLRYGLTGGQPQTLDEIGQVYGVTRERIRQIQAEAMAKLRKSPQKERLRDYLQD